jgi:hypothetical protein
MATLPTLAIFRRHVDRLTGITDPGESWDDRNTVGERQSRDGGGGERLRVLPGISDDATKVIDPDVIHCEVAPDGA